jgi:hypothetical protein
MILRKNKTVKLQLGQYNMHTADKQATLREQSGSKKKKTKRGEFWS